MVTTPGPDDSAAAGYDPLRQLAELAGDVRDPYPMFAGIRADTPVMEVHFGTGSGGRYRYDERRRGGAAHGRMGAAWRMGTDTTHSRREMLWDRASAWGG